MAFWFNNLLILVLGAALFIVVLSDDRRLSQIGYATAMVILFVLNIQFWLFGFALSKLLTSLMSIIILSISPIEKRLSLFGKNRTGKLFRTAVFIFVLILIFLTVSKTAEIINLNVEQTLASMLLILCGIILLGLSMDTYYVVLGLLMVFIGFEVVYGSVENSLLINGMLTAVILLISTVGSYLLNQHNPEEPV